jgi:2-isopropylmalate synthase
LKAREFGLDLETNAIPALLQDIKEREARGYTFEVADASLELLMRGAMGWAQHYFTVESYKALVQERWDEGALAEATVKIITNDERHIETAEGQGPVGALDNALRKALTNEYPELAHMSLEDYRVRVLDENIGTGAVVRVLIDTSNGEREWTTVGVSENILEASWEALVEAYTFGLLHPRAHAES